MKKLFLIPFLCFFAIIIASCTSNNQNETRGSQAPEVNVTSSINPSDGLDLKLVGALLQDGKCKNAEELEKEINKEGGINNLDLDNNKSIDFVNVTENDPKGSTSSRSFDLTTGDKDNLTHIATMEVEKVGNEYKMNMSGNQEIYGNDCNYSSNYGPSFGQLMFFHWMFAPRHLYYHPYYYHGYYPGYYGAGYVRPRVVSGAAYTQRTSTQRTSVTKTVTRTSTPSTNKIKSSNSGKTSQLARTSINNNRVSQKSFGTRDANKSVSKGGFTGNSSSNRSSGNRSSFGGSSSSRSSYGSGSSSSRSSYGSGSSSSRSSFGGGSSSRSSYGSGSSRR